jgi:transposase
VSLLSILKKLLGVEKATLRSAGLVEEKGEMVIVADVQIHRRHRYRCPRCKRKSRVYDLPYESRRWRTLDLGGHRAYIQMPLPRVECPRHGVVAAWVPWAAHGARVTAPFEAMVAWAARHLPRTAVAEMLRIDWKSVGGIAKRVFVNSFLQQISIGNVSAWLLTLSAFVNDMPHAPTAAA